MKKHKYAIFSSFGILILMILLIGYGFIMDGKTQEAPINLSILVYGNDSERWISLKQGAEQAEKDNNVIINYVTTSVEESPGEQKLQIQREIANGAKGILIAASDSTKLEETVAELVQKVPIIMIETGVNNVETLEYLSADNFKMGENLADTIKKDDPEQKVAVILEHLQRDSVRKRRQGLVETLHGMDVVYWESMESTITNLSNFKEMLTKNKVDSVVALDNSTLEKLVDMVTAEKLNVKVYGIGSTDKVVYYLDKGVIQSIVFQNEFSIGYLGIEKLYHKITNDAIGETPEIEFQVIDKSTMYTRDNQRLLFPQVE